MVDGVELIDARPFILFMCLKEGSGKIGELFPIAGRILELEAGASKNSGPDLNPPRGKPRGIFTVRITTHFQSAR